MLFPMVVFGAEALEQGKEAHPVAPDKVALLQNSVVKTAAELRDIILGFSGESVLYLWDLDLTLCRPKGLRFMDHVVRLKEIMDNLTPEGKDVFQADVARLPMSLVNVGIPAIIDELNARGAKSIVLTARLAGGSAFGGSMEETTYQQLTALGIHLAEDFGGVSEKEVESPLYRGHKPLFYKGALLANGEYGSGCDKGNVLVRFLQGVDRTPEAIIMVDDKKENLDRVQKALKESFPAVVFHGVQYLEAYCPGDVSPPPHGFDYERFLLEQLKKSPLSLPSSAEGGMEDRGGASKLLGGMSGLFVK